MGRVAGLQVYGFIEFSLRKANVTPLARLPHTGEPTARCTSGAWLRDLRVCFGLFFFCSSGVYTDTVVEKSPTGTFATPERSELQTVPRRKPSRLAPPMSTLKVDEVNSVLAEDGACGLDVAQQPAAEDLRLG